MADQNFMDLASKTASGIAGTDYMMLVNNSEAYKALVNDVAEAILSKLTSKRFSGLETTAKNVIGALNELNSKILIGENTRYIKVVSNSSSDNWGGILLATNRNISLVSISGKNAPEIVWSSTSPATVTVKSGESNPLETIIDAGPGSHILAMPIGSISRSRITIMG